MFDHPISNPSSPKPRLKLTRPPPEMPIFNKVPIQQWSCVQVLPRSKAEPSGSGWPPSSAQIRLKSLGGIRKPVDTSGFWVASNKHLSSCSNSWAAAENFAGKSASLTFDSNGIVVSQTRKFPQPRLCPLSQKDLGSKWLFSAMASIFLHRIWEQTETGSRKWEI
jgi:hypothetical protein